MVEAEEKRLAAKKQAYQAKEPKQAAEKSSDKTVEEGSEKAAGRA